MYFVTSSQMREMEAPFIKAEGELPLMEKAAIHVANHAARLSNCGAIDFVCGCGNNGGDGIAAARILSQQSIPVRVLLLDISPLRTSCQAQLQLAKDCGVEIIEIKDEIALLRAMQDKQNRPSLLVDAIFGIGLSRTIIGLAQKAISIMNDSHIPILAVDIPSGIHADTGSCLGIAPKCIATVTFSYLKPGHILYPGHDYCGSCFVEDIGLDPIVETIKKIEISQDTVAPLLISRPVDGHKGTFGHLGLFAGCQMMPGAAALAASAALRGGVGLLTLLSETLPNHLPNEAIWNEIKGSIMIDGFLQGKSAFAIGPGIGQGQISKQVLTQVLQSTNQKLVLDADALNIMAQDQTLWQYVKGRSVITPHLGEFARLCHKTIDQISQDPISNAMIFAELHEVVVVLKGASTIVASPSGQLAIYCGGNSGMAKGGSGDVLTGLLGSLLAQGYNTYDAALLTVYIHGESGKIAALQHSSFAMKAGDIPDYFGKIFLRLLSR